MSDDLFTLFGKQKCGICTVTIPEKGDRGHCLAGQGDLERDG